MSKKSLQGILRTSQTRYEEINDSFDDDKQLQLKYHDQDEKAQQEDDNNCVCFIVDGSSEQEVLYIEDDDKKIIDSDNNYCLHSIRSDNNYSISARLESSIRESTMLPPLGDEERHDDDCDDHIFILEL